VGQSRGGLSDGSDLPEILLDTRQKTFGVADDPGGVFVGQWGSLQVIVLFFASLARPAVYLAVFRFKLAWLDEELIERRLGAGMASALDVEPQKHGGCHVKNCVVSPVRCATPMTVPQIILGGQEIVAGFGEAGFDVGALGGIIHRSMPSCSMLRASSSWCSRILS